MGMTISTSATASPKLPNGIRIKLPKNPNPQVQPINGLHPATNKDLEAALETALEKLRRYKHTLRVSEEAAFTPSDEA